MDDGILSQRCNAGSELSRVLSLERLIGEGQEAALSMRSEHWRQVTRGGTERHKHTSDGSSPYMQQDG